MKKRTYSKKLKDSIFKRLVPPNAESGEYSLEWYAYGPKLKENEGNIKLKLDY